MTKEFYDFCSSYSYFTNMKLYIYVYIYNMYKCIHSISQIAYIIYQISYIIYYCILLVSGGCRHGNFVYHRHGSRDSEWVYLPASGQADGGG